MALDEETKKHLNDLLVTVSDRDHVPHDCCPRTERRTAEYISHLLRDHINSAKEYFSPRSLSLLGEEANRYRAIKAEVARAGTRYFVEDPFWNTQLAMDQQPLGYNFITLHDYAPAVAAAMSIREKMISAPAQTAAEMHHGLAGHWLNSDAPLLQPDRHEFMASVYTQPDALAVLKAQYGKRDIGRILSVLPAEQYFVAWEHLFPEAQPAPEYARSPARVSDALALHK